MPELMGFKGGSSVPKQGKMEMKKRAGEDGYRIGQNLTPDQLKQRMEELSKDNLEEVIKQREQEKATKEAMEASYKAWLTTPIEKEYANEKLLIPDTVIIRLFYYNESPNVSSTLILTDEVKEAYHRVLPIAKVLVSNTEVLSPGDIVKIPAVYAKNVLSQEWEQWSKDVTEQPSLRRNYPQPPRYVGRLNEWSNYMYQLDPFSDTSIEDQHTFCIPFRMLQTASI